MFHSPVANDYQPQGVTVEDDILRADLAASIAAQAVVNSEVAADVTALEETAATLATTSAAQAA